MQGIPQLWGCFTAQCTIAKGVIEGCTLPQLVSISLQPRGDLDIYLHRLMEETAAPIYSITMDLSCVADVSVGLEQ